MGMIGVGDLVFWIFAGQKYQGRYKIVRRIGPCVQIGTELYTPPKGAQLTKVE